MKTSSVRLGGRRNLTDETAAGIVKEKRSIR